MIGKCVSCAVALSLLWAPLTAPAADQYWAYTYKGIDVTAAGSAEYARTIAHNLHRLDLSLAAVLSGKRAEWRSPTLVYAVPDDTFTLLFGKKDNSISSVFYSNSFSSSMLINNSSKGDDRLWSIYFGFTGSVLNSAYSFRYPQWFISGLSEVFAASKMDHFKVVVGGYASGRIYTLNHSAFIPLKTLVALKKDDPQFASENFTQLYAAQTWFLVHQIVIEKQYHDNFYQYFLALDRGQSEDAAFAASFNVSWEALDKSFRDAFAARKVEIINVALQDEKDASEPRRLTQEEAYGRLSILAVEHTPQAAVALKLSAQALSVAPNNEDALIGQARAQLKESDYPAALHSGETLCTTDALSQKGAAACGTVFSALRNAVAAKKASIGMDAGSLAARALHFYEQAVTMNPDDLAAWHGMADLVGETHDVVYARSLLPKLDSVQAGHSHVGALAGSVASLYATVGDYENAVKYGVKWQNNALSGSERSRADAYVSRLKDAWERKRIVDGPSALN
jgi:hypothetical protein